MGYPVVFFVRSVVLHPAGCAPSSPISRRVRSCLRALQRSRHPERIDFEAELHGPHARLAARCRCRHRRKPRDWRGGLTLRQGWIFTRKTTIHSFSQPSRTSIPCDAHCLVALGLLSRSPRSSATSPASSRRLTCTRVASGVDLWAPRAFLELLQSVFLLHVASAPPWTSSSRDDANEFVFHGLYEHDRQRALEPGATDAQIALLPGRVPFIDKLLGKHGNHPAKPSSRRRVVAPAGSPSGFR